MAAELILGLLGACDEPADDILGLLGGSLLGQSVVTPLIGGHSLRGFLSGFGILGFIRGTILLLVLVLGALRTVVPAVYWVVAGIGFL